MLHKMHLMHFWLPEACGQCYRLQYIHTATLPQGTFNADLTFTVMHYKTQAVSLGFSLWAGQEAIQRFNTAFQLQSKPAC